MSSERSHDQIAVVGMSCRVPGAADHRQYWRNLAAGVESIAFPTDDELRARGATEEEIASPYYVKAAAMLDDITDFDARFFGFTNREADIRDPQSRLFLEACYAALEDGGYDFDRNPGDVGVFGGMGVNQYRPHYVDHTVEADEMGKMAVETSNGADYLTTAVSHRLNLRGPSVTTLTACSTSLVAVHLAAQSLRAGECELALAGGVNVEHPVGVGYWWTEGGILSRDGHCRAFDADASGTIFGSGVGVVLLKRLVDADADGDHVYAVLRGSAINNDGGARSAFTAPSIEGQAELVRAALAAARVNSSSIGYVEAHGTGTAVGDPVEMAALTKAFRAGGDRSLGRCRIGSVKPNIGHLGAAAGVAGLIKVCLAFQHEVLPPSINMRRPNRRIDFDDSPFYVNTGLTPWLRGSTPRLAGVSSFGIGGTNAHLVVEEPAVRARRANGFRRRLVLPVSAKTETALAAASQRLAEHLASADGVDCAEVARTLQTGRAAFAYRRTVIAGTPPEAATALSAPPAAVARPARGRAVAFMFPGQGTQYPGMGAGLYESEPVFRDAVDRCADVLTPLLGLDPRTLLLADPAEREAVAPRLRQTSLAQPALFTVGYAVAETLASWGITPVAMIGHSVGEWVAAYLAGVFSLPDALALVAERGRLMQSMPAGAMLAVQLPENRTAELIAGGPLEIAAVNAPDATVVSGPADAVDALRALLADQAVSATRLHTSHAFHSRSMEPILAEFRTAVAAVRRSAPATPFISCVTGTWIEPDAATDPEYWARQLRLPVRFADGVGTLTRTADRLLLEVGPGDALTGLARRTVGEADVPVLSTMRGATRAADDDTVLADALGRLWVAGVSPDWDQYWGKDRPGRTPLPAYPFERRRFWLQPASRSGPTPAARDAGRSEPQPAERSTAAIRWRQRSIQPVDAPEVASQWLLLSSGSPVLDALRERLVAAGARVVLATAGPAFRALAEDRYTVRPAERADLGALLAAVAGDDGLPTRIVHAFTATEPPPDPLAADAVAEATDAGFYSLLYLAQEVTKYRGNRDVEVFAVSSNTLDVTGAERLEPAKATLSGPVQLIGRELAGVRCRGIDIELPAPDGPAAVADQLFTELVSGDERQPVAWRGRKRWVMDYEIVPLHEPPGVPGALRERGVYLIAGGLGDIGLALARELARLVGARLVLIGRTPVPGRDAWPALLADPQTPARLREQLERLVEIEAAGGEVLVRACDLTDAGQLAAVVDEATARFGGLHGAFHSAGVPGGGMLAVRTRADAERVLAPKVAGTLALHRVLGGRVDFIVLFSSLSAVAADFGLVDYCAANAFQDAFARFTAARGEPVYSIGWTRWRGHGMGATDGSLPLIVRELHAGTRSEPVGHPLLDRRVYGDGDNIVFSTVLRPDAHWIITEHTIGEVQVVPGTALIEMIRAGFAEAFGPGPVELRDVVFVDPITVTEPTELRLVLRPADDGYDASVAVTRASTAYLTRVEHCRARVRRGAIEAAPAHDLAVLAARCPVPVGGNPGDGEQPEWLVRYGQHWNAVGAGRLGDGEEITHMALPEPFRAECADYVLHPGLLDAAVSLARRSTTAGVDSPAFLPLAYGRIVVRSPLPPTFIVHTRHTDPAERDEFVSDIVLVDDDGRELVRVERYTGRRVAAEAVRSGIAALAAPVRPGGAGPANGGRDEGAHGPDWSLTEPTAMDILRRILHHRPEPHVLVCTEGLERVFGLLAQLTGETLARELAKAELPVSTSAERTVATPYVAPEDDLQRLLAELLANALGLAQVGVDDDFFELGGNSLVAVQLGIRLRERLGTDVPIASLLDRPTVRGLAAALEKMLTDARQPGRHPRLDSVG